MRLRVRSSVQHNILVFQIASSLAIDGHVGVLFPTENFPVITPGTPGP
jgi:hypothetical protein